MNPTQKITTGLLFSLALFSISCAQPEAKTPAAEPATELEATSEVAPEPEEISYEAAYPEEVSGEELDESDQEQMHGTHSEDEGGHSHGEDTHNHGEGASDDHSGIS